MQIPKGATVILNTWGLHHDPVKFPDPDVFEPMRYANSSGLAAERAASPDFESRDHYGYGSGRRICPGLHLADRNLFLAMAKLLWGFKFTEKTDSEGNAVKVNTDAIEGYSQGFIHAPKPFEASVTLRSEARRDTIMREFQVAEEEIFSRYEST